MSEHTWRDVTIVKKNSDFIEIKAYSGYSLQFEDPEATEYLLEPDISNETLGKVVFDSLRESRFLPLEKAQKLREGNPERYKEWVKGLMDRYGYKTKRALFKGMKSCSIECYGNIIEIHPTNHETLEGWGGTGINESDYVKIPADSSPAEVGAALRLAFSRCIG